ncbi:DUF559 domain-containing protein [Paenibacillus sp. MCAF20]
MTDFQNSYDSWIAKCLKEKKGEDRRRLGHEHGYAEKLFLEKVWFPVFYHFDSLNPEFEVEDYIDGKRYLDFTYIRDSLRLAIEIDGYKQHASHATRAQFADSLMRQNHLVLDGWRILRFSFDHINDKPRMCQQVIQQFLGNYSGGTTAMLDGVNIFEAEVIRLGIRPQRSIRVADVCAKMELNTRNSRKLLRSMLDKQQLVHSGVGQVRIRSYRVISALMLDKKGLPFP